MGLSAVTYALAKKYTDETAIQFGGLKGAPCKVRSIEKDNGRSVITLEWKNDDGDTRTSEVYVNDGVSVWVSGRDYIVNDIVVYNDKLFICKIANSDDTFNENKWGAVGGSSDVQIRELTKAQYEALTPAEKTNGTIYFVTDEAGGGGGSAELTSDMSVVKAVGGIPVGKQYPEGTSLEDILRDMLSPVLYPTLTNPSATITATGAKLLETGSTLTTVMTVTFNRGSINPAYGTSGKRSGEATGYSLNGGAVQTTNTFNVTVTSAQMTYTATVNYAAGEQPKDSAGDNYSSPLPAGSVNSSILKYEFVDALYANTVSANVMTKQALVSKSAGSKEFSLVATTKDNPEQIDVPGSWTVSKIEVFNTFSSKWEDITTQFTQTTTSHDDAAGNPVSYNRYTWNRGMALGARDIKVYWS